MKLEKLTCTTAGTRCNLQYDLGGGGGKKRKKKNTKQQLLKKKR